MKTTVSSLFFVVYILYPRKFAKRQKKKYDMSDIKRAPILIITFRFIVSFFGSVFINDSVCHRFTFYVCDYYKTKQGKKKVMVIGNEAGKNSTDERPQ